MVRKIIVFLFLIAPLLYGQQSAIKGSIRDATNQQPLSGANIMLKEIHRGTTSDQYGRFVFQNIPAGSYTFIAKYLGYETFRTKITVTADKPSTIDVALKPTALLGKEVVVVATRAVQGETPAAFATLKQEDIKIRYFAQDVPALLSELPSTTFYSESGNGIGYNYISIRGFDQRRISVMINGVPQNDPEDHNVYWVDFPDFLGNVESIQVQRGAGSAFYGPPAIGGSINIITSQFSAEPKITGYVGSGSYNTRKYSLSLNSGLIRNKYVLFARASQIKSDGYREQSWVDFKSYFLGAARFGEKSTTRLHFYGGPIADHLAYYGISKQDAMDREKRRTNPIKRPDEIENFNQPHLELINEYQISDNIKLNNTLFWIRGYGFFDYDGSWAPMSYYRLTPEYGFSVPGNPEDVYVSDLLIRAYVDNKQVGWMPQVRWDFTRGEMVVGAEIRRHRSLHWGRIQKASGDLPVGASGAYKGLSYIGARRYYEYRGAKDILSPYFHSTFKFIPGVNLMLDLQLAYKKYRLYDEAFVGNDFSLKYYFLNPRFGVNFKLTPEFNFFTSISRTSREPRLKNFYDAAEASTPESWGKVVPQFELNADGSYNFDKPLVQPESLNDFEVGLGYQASNWLANVNLFYMNFQNEIIKKGQLDRFGQPITGNADRTLHKGIEFQIRGNLLRNLTLDANATLSQNKLVRYSVYKSDGSKLVLDGNPIAGFPNSLANIRLTYHNGRIQSSLAMQHVGKTYTDNFKNEEHTVDPYTVFNGMLGYSFQGLMGLSSLNLQLHIQNIFDTLYIAHGESDEFFPAAERQIFLNLNFEL